MGVVVKTNRTAIDPISLLRADSRQNVRRILWPEWRRSATIGVLKSVEPTGFLGLRTRVCGNKLGGCESAGHPKLPARPRMSFVFARLFGSGSAGLGVTARTGAGGFLQSRHSPVIRGRLIPKRAPAARESEKKADDHHWHWSSASCPGPGNRGARGIAAVNRVGSYPRIYPKARAATTVQIAAHSSAIPAMGITLAMTKII